MSFNGPNPDRIETAQVPLSSFVKMRDKHLAEEFKPFVTPYSTSAYKQLDPVVYKEMGATLHLSETGRTGYALKPDGDIISVFSSAGEKGGGSWAIRSAIENGGSKLDCFDGFLPGFYSKFGFQEYDRWAWDDQYAPDGWDYEKYDQPDIVLMELDMEMEA